MAANFLATISAGGSLAELTASSRQRCTLIKMACAERVRGGQKRNASQREVKGGIEGRNQRWRTFFEVALDAAVRIKSALTLQPESSTCSTHIVHELLKTECTNY